MMYKYRSKQVKRAAFTMVLALLVTMIVPGLASAADLPLRSQTKDGITTYLVVGVKNQNLSDRINVWKTRDNDGKVSDSIGNVNSFSTGLYAATNYFGGNKDRYVPLYTVDGDKVGYANARYLWPKEEFIKLISNTDTETEENEFESKFDNKITPDPAPAPAPEPEDNPVLLLVDFGTHGYNTGDSQVTNFGAVWITCDSNIDLSFDSEGYAEYGIEIQYQYKLEGEDEWTTSFSKNSAWTGIFNASDGSKYPKHTETDDVYVGDTLEADVLYGTSDKLSDGRQSDLFAHIRNGNTVEVRTVIILSKNASVASGKYEAGEVLQTIETPTITYIDGVAGIGSGEERVVIESESGNGALLSTAAVTVTLSAPVEETADIEYDSKTTSDDGDDDLEGLITEDNTGLSEDNEPDEIGSKGNDDPDGFESIVSDNDANLSDS